ncbi:hypothetical protein C1752_10458 [Acaryochloris thomasi RCC1774]|uniref:Uncharacterized protein n=1 Tax=Acaryochloris thomasi RCC1774 TaxID=1764569 RepID=A0A2W1J921_9CYAN|nr:hypothetical protein [Acaryochloris thomasi]PZD70608.1 hypothetical protein C1752_10458 [Acaryochloris thomasi RCC1774]
MAKNKKVNSSELEAALKERFGDLSVEELSSQTTALYTCLGLEPQATEMTTDQYHLGVQILDAFVNGHAQDYQQAKEWVESQGSGQPESQPSQSEEISPVHPSGDLPAAISEQGGKLYKKVPDTFARQDELFGTALDQAVLADLNERIRTGDLEADIQEAMGKRQREGRERAPTFIEMLGLPAVPSAPKLPESSAE